MKKQRNDYSAIPSFLPNRTLCFMVRAANTINVKSRIFQTRIENLIGDKTGNILYVYVLYML